MNEISDGSDNKGTRLVKCLILCSPAYQAATISCGFYFVIFAEVM